MTIEDRTIYTYSGRKFALRGGPEQVAIADIAHALSNQCRFTGHVRHFYSVAQHSVYVSHLVEEAMCPDYDADIVRVALLHDASEAYLSDLARPFKGAVSGYKDVELRLQARIFDAFGLSQWRAQMPSIVKYWDMIACYVEARDLHNGPVEQFQGYADAELTVNALPTIYPQQPAQAKIDFLRRAAELKLSTV